MTRGYLLHSRPYRETSLIACCLTESDGRLDMVVRSARGAAKGRVNTLMPFVVYELGWVGRGELKQLREHEPLGLPANLAGERLYCGFYLNELLYRLLPLQQPEPGLLDAYADSLRRLADEADPEPVLRCFELALLDILGYGLDFSRDADGQSLDPLRCYRYVPERGLFPLEHTSASEPMVAVGGHFLALQQRDFSGVECRRLGKTILRTVLAHYLGGKPLRSRELFRP